MCFILIVCVIFLFCYNLICMNVCVWYKYNITLYNLIIRKYYYMYLHCYHVIITVCYKVSNSKKKKK